MRHAGILLALLAAATQLPACATTGSPGVMQGQPGPVAWEIADVQRVLEENGFRMRWNFTLVFKNVGGVPFDFERVEVNSRAGGPSDDTIGGMATVAFVHRLEPGAVLKVTESETWGCSQCPPGRLSRVFSDGVIVYTRGSATTTPEAQCEYPWRSTSTAASGSNTRGRSKSGPLSPDVFERPAARLLPASSPPETGSRP
jgi:hypothetical protein